MKVISKLLTAFFAFIIAIEIITPVAIVPEGNVSVGDDSFWEYVNSCDPNYDGENYENLDY